LALWACIAVGFEDVAAARQHACPAGDTDCLDEMNDANENGYTGGGDDADFDDETPSGQHRYTGQKDSSKSTGSLGALGGAFVADGIWSEVSRALASATSTHTRARARTHTHTHTHTPARGTRSTVAQSKADVAPHSPSCCLHCNTLRNHHFLTALCLLCVRCDSLRHQPPPPLTHPTRKAAQYMREESTAGRHPMLAEFPWKLRALPAVPFIASTQPELDRAGVCGATTS